MANSSDRSVVVVVGNPQAASRTATVAGRLGQRLADLVDAGDAHVIDLAVLGPALLQWGDPTVAEAKAAVRAATVVVVASPTYKAAYTGLLKLFLDQFEHGELRSVPAVVPLMTGGGPTHALAVEVHLRPVLVEIGARVPSAGLYVWGEQVDDPSAAIEAWWSTEADVVARAVGGAGG
ncbi:NAD(P)H-dependent oxidoreductase [Dermatobacter hominis]|uniref:NAD(P)H-dependent oxidoreductase n=1 Tax=Dermatobacter hominis TaxID=2884263 RepID=UPI001D0FD036|nr:NAD(P)H-dependent oxidoreductase [Dermatobacter hominis]UDY35122.1 NAD(P)H-dependent oxidoreductase [Dermatobacter hominis]